MKKLLLILITMLMVLAITACAVPQAEQQTGSALVDSAILAEIAAFAVRFVLCIIFAIITHKLLPLLEKWGLLQTIRTFVRAAEKKGETGAIQKINKKAYVIRNLEALGVQMSPLIDSMIEAAVEEIDAFGKKIAEDTIE